MFRCHGYRNPARHYIMNNTCAACLRVFATRERCVHHFAYDSVPCLILIKSIYLPLPVEVVLQLDDEAVKLRNLRAKTRVPLALPRRAAGPLINACLAQHGPIQFS